MDSKNKAKLYMVLSTATFGTLSVFVRNIQLPSGEIALYRAALASLLLIFYLLISKNFIPLKSIKRELPLLLISGGLMGFNWILLFEAYNYTSVSLATLSCYFAPVIVTIACPFLFKERMTKKQALCFCMSTLGIILLIGVSGLGQSGTDIIGIAMGLGAAVCYASVILINKFIQNVSGIHRTLMQFFAAIVVLIPYVALTGGFHLNSLDSSSVINMLIVGLFHTGITYCMYFSALKELPGQEASILSYIDPTVAVLVSFLIFHESMTVLQAIGGLLVIGFSVYNEIGTGSDSQA